MVSCMAETARFFGAVMSCDFPSSAIFRFFMVKSGGGVTLALDDASDGRRERRDVGGGDIVKVGVGIWKI